MKLNCSAGVSVLGLAALAAAASVAVSANSWAQQPAPPSAAPARISLTLNDATLTEAAAAVSRATRLPVVAPEALAGMPVGRRRLALANASVSQALREFGRAFDCNLRWGPLPNGSGGGYLVRPGPAPGGPEIKLPGYRVAVLGLFFTDRRSFDENSTAVFADRSLGIQLSARAENGDTAPIDLLDNVRVVDQSGRDALAQLNDADEDEFEGEPVVATFPDEQPQRFVAEWPYPTPHLLKLIEGELVLYKKVRRATLRLPVPPEGAPPSTLRFGESRAQLMEDQSGDRYLLRITYPTPPGLEPPTLAFAGEFPFLFAQMPDGSQLPLDGTMMSRTVQLDSITEEFWIPMEPDALRPAQIVARVAVRSEPGRRLRFRIENFPATLAPPDPAAEALPPARPPVKSPAKKAPNRRSQEKPR